MNSYASIGNRIALAFLVAVSLSACAKSASEVQPAYVSPVQYENYSCKQLGDEAKRISQRAAELSGVQDDKAAEDAFATAAAIIVFLPAAFLIGGDDHMTVELARLKGEFETIKKVSAEKNCNLKFQERSS